MQTTTELPIELECFLLKYGFFEKEHAPGYKPHAPYTPPRKQVKLVSAGWYPAFKGEEPPF